MAEILVSMSFNPDQQYVPQEKLIKNLETAMVDMVNLCGVDVNEAVSDLYTANSTPVCVRSWVLGKLHSSLKSSI